ncbi:hypothetical protein skT53_11670 [Effusibacillus dendaii]|uniref:Uncharacterized protein n=1 Tax=Effusibacillus dendaii TaxID=2743772 RepID=A0A7I8D9Y7_9BACL|nr:hypothetical protein skT53_11670 [Effusibacillus dendaii]
MWGLLAFTAALFWLLAMCSNITAEKFNKAIKKQHEQWEK